MENMDDEKKCVNKLMQTIIEHVPSPEADAAGDFSMLITQTESSQYFGRMLIGRV